MFDKVIEQIKKTHDYKRRNFREAVGRVERYRALGSLLELTQICDIKISLSDLFALSKETDIEELITEDIQAEFIFERFQEIGIDCNFTDFRNLTKEQFALCMHLATIHYCEENL